jgi:hypothetical protein
MPHRHRTLVVSTLVALVLAAGAYLLLHPTDEALVRARLDRLASAARVTDADAQANPVARLARVSADLTPLFEPDVRVSIPEVPSLPAGRAELAELVAGAPAYLRSFEIDLTNVTVILDEARTTARVGAMAHVRLVERDGAGEIRRDERAVDLRFVKKDGEWVVHTLTVWSKEDAPAP